MSINNWVGGSGGPQDIGGTDIETLRRQRAEGTGGLRGSGFQAQAAYDAYIDNFGREPTVQELNAAIPSFRGDGGFEKGNAFVANLALVEQEAKKTKQEEDPIYQYKKQQADLLAEAPKYYGDVEAQFKAIVGRDPSQQELQHFGIAMASGTVDAYTLGQFLGQLPEVGTRKNEEARTKLRGELSAADTEFLSQEVAPKLQSYFAARGRPNTSGLDYALAKQAGDLNTEREKYLAGIGYQDYANSRENTLNQYLNSLGRYQGLEDYSTQRNAQLADTYRNRRFGLQDYQMQMNAYEDYLRRYGKRSSGMGGLLGSSLGMGLGALLAAPTGGMSIPMGMMLGSSLGGTGGQFGESAYNGGY